MVPSISSKKRTKTSRLEVIHSSKIEFLRSFFGGNRRHQIPFRNYLTFNNCLRNFSSNSRNVNIQSDFVKYLTPLHCVLPFLPFPSQQPGLSALNRKKPGKGRPQKKEGHGWLLLGQRKNGFAVLTFCIAVTTGTTHIDAFGTDLVQSRNKISFCIYLCIF